MVSRTDILSKASEDCLKELYSLCQPKINWDDFIEMNKKYSNKYRAWENYKKLFQEKDKNPEKWLEIKSCYPPNWETDSITDCIGPIPCDFFYIPKKIFDDTVESYIYAYKLDEHQNLLDIIEILKKYCKDPIIDKYIEGYTDEYGNHHPGYRSYDRPNNLEQEIREFLESHYDLYNDGENKSDPKELQDITFKFLDMAGNFFTWNSEINSFRSYIYFGPCPSSNKEKVINNWKKYKNEDIEIDESIYNEEEE